MQLIEAIEREISGRQESVTMDDLEGVPLPAQVLAATSMLIAILREQYPSICADTADETMSVVSVEDAPEFIGHKFGFVATMSFESCDTKSVVQLKTLQDYCTALIEIEPSDDSGVALVEVEGDSDAPSAESYELSFVFGYGGRVGDVQTECCDNANCECNLKEEMSDAEREALPLSAFVFPDRRAWPLHDKKHAEIAIQYMKMGRGNKEEYPQIRKEIAKRYPTLKDKLNESLEDMESSTIDLDAGAMLQNHLKVQPAPNARDILSSISEAVMDVLPAMYMYGSQITLSAVKGDAENAETSGDLDGVGFEAICSMYEDSASIGFMIPDMDSFVAMSIGLDSVMSVLPSLMTHLAKAFSSDGYVYSELEDEEV